MIKNVGEKGIQMLTQIYNKIWKEEKIPKEWQIMPIYNKGDKRSCNNYRGISLISTLMRILEQILDKRIRATVERTLEEAQSGFRKGRSTQDHIFAIEQIAYKAMQEKKRIYAAFIDLEKAFDTIPREKLWKMLEERGVNGKTLRIIKTIYKLNVNNIIYNNKRSKPFTTTGGLRQGGGLSPSLFIIFMDEIIKNVGKNVEK